MLELSKLVPREVLQSCRTKDFSLDHISIEELSKVAAVLGRQQNYYDLEVSLRLPEPRCTLTDFAIVASESAMAFSSQTTSFVPGCHRKSWPSPG